MFREFTVRVSRSVPAAPAVVWSLLADLRHDPLWREGVISMSQDGDGTVSRGTRTVEEYSALGQHLIDETVVGAVEDGVSFTWRTTFGTDADGERRIDAQPDGSTLVTLTSTSRSRTGFARLLAPLVEPTLRRALQRSLERFEYLAEARAEASREANPQAGPRSQARSYANRSITR